MPPAGTVTYRFPDITKSLRSKDFSDPLTSIARRRGSDYINKSASIHDYPFGCGPIDIGHVPQGGCGIRTHAPHNDLTVFKTVPLNQTWVILRKINKVVGFNTSLFTISIHALYDAIRVLMSFP